MHSFYFTFGSHPNFPFKNGYIIIKAETLRQACRFFKAMYPNPDCDDILNCSDYYNEKQWKEATANHDMTFYGYWDLKFYSYGG